VLQILRLNYVHVQAGMFQIAACLPHSAASSAAVIPHIPHLQPELFGWLPLMLSHIPPLKMITAHVGNTGLRN